MNIALAPSGDFELTLPSGRKLFIPVTPHASAFIAKLLYSERSGHTLCGPGYIGAYPTQAIVDAWLKEARANEQRATADRYGVDLDLLDISL